jgi:hypothetical protein
MAIDKAIEYKMQGNKKPAKNYLGKQKTVSKVPVKWQSGPDTPPTELAYITEAEKDLLLKADLHGSLKDGPNTGPDGIMSLDSQGDYTQDRSPGAYGGGGNNARDREQRARNEQNMREILTGQKNIGQTTKTGPKTRKYAVPEYVKVRQPGGGYKNTYIGSGYKSYGTPSFFGNLLSRGAPGYRGIKGMPAFFGKPKFDLRQGPDGMGYYSDYEKFGETRDAFPKFGLLGLISSLAEKFKKPKDMSEFNNLQLVDGELVDTRNIESKNIPVPSNIGMESLALQNFFNKQTPKTFSDPFRNTVGTTTKVNTTNDAVSSNNIPTVNGVPMIDTGSVYQDNLNFFDNLNKGLVVNNEPPMVNTDNVMQGSVLDAKPKKGIMQTISDFFFTPAGADEFDMEAFQKAGAKKGFLGANDELEAMKEYYDAAKSLTAPGGKFAGANDPAAVRNFITKQSAIPFGGGSYGVEMGMVPENFMNKTEDFTTQKDPLSFFAEGGLASMFTRRG